LGYYSYINYNNFNNPITL